LCISICTDEWSNWETKKTYFTEEFKVEHNSMQNLNIPAVSVLACPNCGSKLQLEVKEMTNSDLIKALQVNKLMKI